MKSAAGRDRIEQHERRVNQALAEHVEAADRREAELPRPEVKPSTSAARSSWADMSPDPSDLVPFAMGTDGQESGNNRMDDGNVGQPADGEGMDVDMIEDDDDIGVRECEDFIGFFTSQLGGHGRSRQRDRKVACKRMIYEVYSPPRVIKEARRYGLTPGIAMDLTTIDPADGMPWDFSIKAKRERARDLVSNEAPIMLVGSVMCTAYSAWQNLNQQRNPTRWRIERTKAQLHLDFVCQLYEIQISNGRYFLHEHPTAASSWAEKCVQRIAKMDGVQRQNADQCQFGLQVKSGVHRGAPIIKPTGFMSNSEEVLKALSKRCSGRGGQCDRPAGGKHQPCSGKIAKEAAIYPRALCRAILKGICAQLKKDGNLEQGVFGVDTAHEHSGVPAQGELPEGCSGKYRDDITKQPLRDELVHAARKTELEYFRSKSVWVKRPRQEAFDKTHRAPITVRWVEVNKGDDENPNYRSRLVARQLKAWDTSGDSFFAPTPPLEALRSILMLTTTNIAGCNQVDRRPQSPNRTQMSFLDISRAYFNAKTDPRDPTYVELPLEDEDSGTMCALLMRHMYGTRKAADGWQQEYSSMLVSELGFSQGTASPCTFFHRERGIACCVHGDDFTSRGGKADLDWFEGEIQARYECRIGPRLGPGDDDAKEATVLNRVVRWTAEGLELEADPRQGEKLVRECGLDGANSVATPGVRPASDLVRGDTALAREKHTAFRGAAARANYLALDRPDLQFAAKEICRWMSAPTELAWQGLKRLGRYIVGLPRLVYKYPWQDASTVDVYSDTDWSGCPVTRKSTSGGCIMIGSQVIKTWSSTLASVALSSGEAEFYGVVRAAGQGLGFQSLLHDLGCDLPLRLWTDSTAAIGICSRQGLGGQRHVATHSLWVQQGLRAGRFSLHKIAGEKNPADLFTKHMASRERLSMLVRLFGCAYVGGRAAAAPSLREASSEKITMASFEGHAVTAVGDDEGYIMPHLVETEESLELNYPAVVPSHEEIKGDDMLWRDDILSRGTAIARGIMEDANARGRLRG